MKLFHKTQHNTVVFREQTQTWKTIKFWKFFFILLTSYMWCDGPVINFHQTPSPCWDWEPGHHWTYLSSPDQKKTSSRSGSFYCWFSFDVFIPNMPRPPAHRHSHNQPSLALDIFSVQKYFWTIQKYLIYFAHAPFNAWYGRSSRGLLNLLSASEHKLELLEHL